MQTVAELGRADEPLLPGAERGHPGPGLAGRDVYALAGMPIDAIDMQGTLQRLERAVQTRERLFISTPNSNFTVAVQSDVLFRRSVQLSNLVVPDGMPLLLFARLLHLPAQGRVTGADLFERLLDHASVPVRVFFLGGPEGAAKTASERVNARGGLVSCVGYCSPGFVPVDDLCTPALVDHINTCRPDFVVVSLGARKSQEWIMRNHPLLEAPIISALGAVVNFTAGSVKRAPVWMQDIGAEWLWRIYQEPALWRRYWDDGRTMLSIFLRQVLPQLPDVWRSNRRPGVAQPSAMLRSSTQQGAMLLSMSGAWRNTDLAELRRALQGAIDLDSAVTVDATGLLDIDARASGLLLLAQARLPSLDIRHATGHVRRTLQRQGLGYLLTAAG